MFRRFFILLLFQITIAGAAGQDFDFGDIKDPAPSAKKTLSYGITGNADLETAYQTDTPRFIRSGTAVFGSSDLSYLPGSGSSFGIHAEGTIRYNAAYDIESDGSYVSDNYRFEGILNEAYASYSSKRFYVAAGKKIEVWSVNDLLPLTDVVNAADQSASLFAKPKEVRLGNNLLLFRFFPGPAGNWELTLLGSPLPATDRLTDGSHPYSIFADPNVSGDTAGYRLTQNKPGLFDNFEAAGRLEYRSSPWSHAIMGGRFFERAGQIDAAIGPPLSFRRQTSSYYMAGTNHTLAMAPFLFRIETAYFHRKKIQVAGSEQVCSPLGCQSYDLPGGGRGADTLALAGGFDYSLGNRGTLTIEADYRHLIKIPRRAYTKRRPVAWGAGYSRRWLNDDLTTSFFALFLESWLNPVARLQIDYRINDNLSVISQYALLIVSDFKNTYGAYDEYDRFDFLVRYDFALENSK